MHLLFLLMVAAAAGSREAALLLVLAPMVWAWVFHRMMLDRQA